MLDTEPHALWNERKDRVDGKVKSVYCILLHGEDQVSFRLTELEVNLRTQDHFVSRAGTD